MAIHTAHGWYKTCARRLDSGTSAVVDSYSAFFDNSKFNQTTMLAELQKRELPPAGFMTEPPPVGA